MDPWSLSKNDPYYEYICCAQFPNKQRKSTNYPGWSLQKVGLKIQYKNPNHFELNKKSIFMLLLTVI